ncbi:MAG: heme-binding protein [Alphaproteobacteria bacterium]|nr:heme-binding protein [Alphaproteobacteria bacterium]
MAKLTLDQADRIIAAALAKAAELKLNPLTIAVLDDGAHLKAFKRQDGPGAPLRPFVAQGKAWGALGMGVSSRAIESRLKERPHFLGALIEASQGRVIPVAGGVLIRDPASHEVVGAVGVSGDTSDNDEAVAIAGIVAAGLKTDA